MDAWRQVSQSNIINSISAAGFSDNYRDWHISKHDVYGEQFRTAWGSALIDSNMDQEAMTEIFEGMIQDDELEEWIDE